MTRHQKRKIDETHVEVELLHFQLQLQHKLLDTNTHYKTQAILLLLFMHTLQQCLGDILALNKLNAISC